MSTGTEKQATNAIDSNALLGKIPHTADGFPIFLKDSVYFENPDTDFFGEEDVIKQRVSSLCAEVAFNEYKGTVTVCCEDWEGGNLDCFAKRENVPQPNV